ncbi:MAG TPA: hypothetical protein VL989_03735 [Candidatus Sulfotelmatobacter sp.]|nr:hypothetical protein [Candidatus Sulfotelmatobacter sp.]
MQEFNQGKWLKRTVLVLVVIVLAVIGFSVFKNIGFRISGVEPDTSNFASISPFMKISFNRTLSSKGLVLSSSYSIISSYKVSGSDLFVDLKVPLTAGYPYYVKVVRVQDTKGNVLKNQTISFTPKNIAFQNLSPDQQRALLETQAKKPDSKANITYNNFDYLTNYGLTDTQVDTLEQAFFNFKEDAKVVTISTPSVAAAPHSADTSSTQGTITFSVSVDGTDYNASVNYTQLGVDAQLYLYNPSTNAQVFNSYSVANGED